MESLMIYFGKMMLCSGAMYIYYLLLLKDKTFHHFNRFYLLASIILSLSLPLLKIKYFTIEVNQNVFEMMNLVQQSSTQTSRESNFLPLMVIALIAIISFFFIIKFLMALVKIQKFKSEFPKENFEGISFYQTNLDSAPFSFFRNLFWKNSILIHSDLGRQILKHEMVHMEQKHSLDKIVLEITQSIFWFNPVFWFIKKEMVLIHEYLADKKAIENADIKAFAQMLLGNHFQGEIIPATSPFLSSNLKKRLKMLKSPKTKYSYARRILALPILFIIAFALLVQAKNKEIKFQNAIISKKMKDTTKVLSATAVASSIDIHQEIKNAPENAMFLIEAKEVTKKEFVEFIEKNKGNKNLVLSMQKKENQINGETVMGERGKNGVFQASLDGAENFKDDYHQLIKKYNPKHYNNVILKSKTENNTISELGKSLQEKSEELTKLKPESKEFENKLNEVTELSNKIANAAKSNEKFNFDTFNITEFEKLFNSKEYKDKMLELEKIGQELEKKFTRPEFQKQLKLNADNSSNKNSMNEHLKAIQDHIKLLESKNFDKMHIEALRKHLEEIKKSSNTYVPSSNGNFNYSEISKNSAEAAKKQSIKAKEIAEIAKKQAKLAEQQAKLAEKSAELARKKIALSGGNSNNVSFYRFTNPSAKINSKTNLDDVKIYLNGKLITKEQMNAISPEDIKTVNIFKRDKNGKGENEIRIITK